MSDETTPEAAVASGAQAPAAPAGPATPASPPIPTVPETRRNESAAEWTEVAACVWEGGGLSGHGPVFYQTRFPIERTVSCGFHGGDEA